MSGIVTSNVFKASGVIAAAPGGLDWSSAVITGSTLSAETGRGYFINTTSNACTVTLPASPAIGDQIVFADYARTWATNNLIIDSNGNNFQGESDLYTVDYSTAGQSLNIVYSDATKGWLPVSDDAVANVPVAPPTQRGIFAFGDTGSAVGMSNLMNSSGVIGNDVSAVGSASFQQAATTYGGDKAIFAYGYNGSSIVNKSNLISNQGVVSSDVTGVGTARTKPAAVGYGTGGLALYAFGYDSSNVTNVQNKVSSAGVIATDSSGVGTARDSLAAAMYGTGLAIFGYGNNAQGGDNAISITNLLSNVGVVGADVTGVGTVRYALAATSYGGDKAIFSGGYVSGVGTTAVSNLVSNTGVVASDTSAVGTVRYHLAASSYGGDKGAFAYGRQGGTRYSVKNLISNSGVVASDTTGVGTARSNLAGAGYSTSA